MITIVTPPANRELSNRELSNKALNSWSQSNRELNKARREKAKRAQLKQKRLKQEQAALKRAARSPAQVMLKKVLAVNAFAIIATAVVSTPLQQLEQQFSEGGFITYFSAVQLCILSYLGYKIFQKRAQNRHRPLHYPMAVWLILSIGFAFLALDELFMIHEWIGEMIHSAWQFEATGLSNPLLEGLRHRIGDIIVGLYGIVAVRLLVHYRREFKKYRHVLPYVIVGFTLMFLMVGVGILTRRDDILMTVFSDDMTASIMSWAFILEKALKLFSESCLIVAGYLCYRRTQHLKLSAQTKCST